MKLICLFDKIWVPGIRGQCVNYLAKISLLDSRKNIVKHRKSHNRLASFYDLTLLWCHDCKCVQIPTNDCSLLFIYIKVISPCPKIFRAPQINHLADSKWASKYAVILITFCLNKGKFNWLHSLFIHVFTFMVAQKGTYRNRSSLKI